MENISIFSSRPFIRHGQGLPDVTFLARASALIRGEQIAEYLGAKHNPPTREGICIYVKPKNLNEVRDGDYVDIMDEQRDLIKELQKRPDVKVIAYSQYSYEYLTKQLKNKVVLIPEHHCNFERVRRDRRKVTTVGFIGNPSDSSVRYHEDMEKRLKEIGLEYLVCWDYKTRQDVVNFYKQIDIQVIGFFGLRPSSHPFSHPNKIINAASFGIPTVAEYKEGYKEFDYTPVQSIDELIKAVESLKEKTWNAKKLIEESEKYHISNIAKLYRKI